MDSDLAESLQALKSVFEKRKMSAQFGAANPALVETLRKTFRIPARYRAFLLEADPLKAETVTPVERVKLFSSAEIAARAGRFLGRRRRHPACDGQGRRVAKDLDPRGAQLAARQSLFPRRLQARRRGGLLGLHGDERRRQVGAAPLRLDVRPVSCASLR